jgi:hypothetical protein
MISAKALIATIDGRNSILLLFTSSLAEARGFRYLLGNRKNLMWDRVPLVILAGDWGRSGRSRFSNRGVLSGV